MKLAAQNKNDLVAFIANTMNIDPAEYKGCIISIGTNNGKDLISLVKKSFTLYLQPDFVFLNSLN